MSSWSMNFQPDTFTELGTMMTFNSLEEGVEWLRGNAPDLLGSKVWSMKSDDYVQYGTNSRWAGFTRLP